MKKREKGYEKIADFFEFCARKNLEVIPKMGHFWNLDLPACTVKF